MSCYNIKVFQGKKIAILVNNRKTYLEIRGSAKQKKLLNAARTKGDKQAKMRLEQFNYSGHYPQGTIKGTKIHSRAFVFDCDDRTEFERIIPILQSRTDELGVLMIERSVSNGGHIVCKRPANKTILESQVWLATELKTEMDCNTHDVNRVLFSTSDDENDLIYLSDELFDDKYSKDCEEESRMLEERVQNGMEQLPEGAHSSNKHFKPWKKNEPAHEAKEPTTNTDIPMEYDSIPYDKIIDKWWLKYNNGNTPVTSNRDVLTYELALNLRHICGFDATILDRIIPCYDGFPETEKMKCIESALNTRRTQMPKRLREVLDEIKQELAQDNQAVEAIESIQNDDLNFYYKELPTMPNSIAESINAVGPSLTMPLLVTVCPMVGMLAYNVKLYVHGKPNTLNLISFVAGQFASGKGNLDPVVEAWTEEVRLEDKTYLMAEEDFRNRKRAAKNKKEQPEEIKYPVRYLTLNNTVANLAERLGNLDGKIAFSFTPEADTMAQKWKSGMTDYSVMLRQAYDASPFSREARSVDAVNVHIDHLRWNVVMVGTPDALYRVLGNNYSDGFQSRIAVAVTPDNTFQPLSENTYSLSPKGRMYIRQVAHLLPFLQGELELPTLEEEGRKWLENIRIESMKDFDTIKARQRFRVCVTTQRMVCCILLCRVCEELIKQKGDTFKAEEYIKVHPHAWLEIMDEIATPELLSCFPTIANALVDTNLLFFRDKIVNENKSNALGYQHSGKNESIFIRLEDTFTTEQAYRLAVSRRGDMSKNAVARMIQYWKSQGLIENVKHGVWKKKAAQ